MDDALITDLAALEGGCRSELEYRSCLITPVVGDVLTRFTEVVRECFAEYRTLSKTLNWCSLLEAPNVLRYEPATPDRQDWFHEHADAWNVPSATRQVSVLAYLNDVAEGGETEFTSFQLAQRCEKGTIMMFPANFMFHHVARPPLSGPKMLVVTWLHFGNNGTPGYRTMPLY